MTTPMTDLEIAAVRDVLQRGAPRIAVSLRSTPRLIATIDARDAEIARLREALEIFATESNWRLGGPFDPNSPSFTGIGFASAALKEARHD